MNEIKANEYNLNISLYVSTEKEDVSIDLSATHKKMVESEEQIQESTSKHNLFLRELGLPPLPTYD